jgi:hypothetical protein
MKRFFFLSIAFFLFNNLAVAQEYIKIANENLSCSVGDGVAYTVNIPQASLRDVQKQWKQYVKKTSRGKLSETGSEIVMPLSKLPALSDSAITVVAKIYINDNYIKVDAFLQDYSGFISEKSTLEKHNSAKAYLRVFAIDQYKDAVKDELKLEQKNLTNLENDLGDLINYNQRTRKDTETRKREIETNKLEIITNKKEIELREKDIDTQRSYVVSLSVKDDPFEKEAKKKLKDMEGEVSKLMRADDKLNDRISSSEMSIEENGRKLIENEKNQEIKKAEIEKQKTKIKGVEDKLDGII